MFKRIAVTILFFSGTAYADSIKVAGELLYNVYIQETSSAYIVKDPKDGSEKSLSKKRTDVRAFRQSEDRKALLKQWEAKKAEQDQESKSKKPAKVLSAKGNATEELARQRYLEYQQWLLSQPPPKEKPLGIGSTQNQVRSKLGEPNRKTTIVSEYGTSETWFYDHGHVSFDNGKLDSVFVEDEK